MPNTPTDPAEALTNHRRTEDEEPEVRTRNGWVDVVDLIQSARHEAWSEGFEAGYDAGISDGADGPAKPRPDNPYPLDRCSPDIGYHASPHVGCFLR
jgi:hypothetical protein